MPRRSHDHDCQAKKGGPVPEVLCLANKNGARLYWGGTDPAEDPDYAHYRPDTGDFLIYAGSDEKGPGLHRYTDSGWEPPLDAADEPGEPQPDGSTTPWPAVSLSKVREAARKDPNRPQGGTTPGAKDHVRTVEDALRREGLLDPKFASDGSFGSKTIEAYAAWQRRIGYTGNGADGIPGQASLTMLGRAWSFVVID